MRRLLFLAGCSPLWLAGILCLAADSAPKAHKNRAAHDALFTNGTVRLIEIEIGEPEVAALKKDSRGYVRATVKEGTQVYTNVGIHLKGVGSFRPIDQKPSFTVKFNKFNPDQEFYGLSRIALNNSVQDPGYLNEALCAELFRAANVPAARVTHAWVRLNGRELGLYVLVEGFNKHFLRRHFQSADGNLYEAYTQDITDELEQDNGTVTDQADLRALVRAATEPNSAERWTRLDKLLDLDRFISMMAVEIIAVHWDGYWINRNNYRIYHDPGTGRFTLLPCGLDNMWQQPTLSWRPTMQGLLIRAVLQTPEGQRRYRERLTALLTNEAFRVEHLTNRVNELAAVVRPALAQRAPATVKDFDAQAAGLRDRIAQRMKSLADQLAALSQLLKFDAAGVARLSGWKSQIDAGPVTLSQGTESSQPVLKIKSSDTSGCVASWRTRAVLEPGRYRFQGRVKIMGLQPPNRAGVGVTLRISGNKPAPQVNADTDWRTVTFDFELQPPADQVELVCELTTLLGEAWFDATSLQLVRLKL